MKISKTVWCGLEAVAMEAGGYEALLIPSMGASMISLVQKEKGVTILRTPSEEEAEVFKTRPQVFGLPLLFPPNRIEDGRYVYNGKTYQYPITIPDQHNYHHGIIKSQPFVVTAAAIGKEQVEVEASFFSNAVNNAIYTDFPHAFTCKMTYILSAAGLQHRVTFINQSDSDMPLGVGYHTPLMVPFLSNGRAEDYKLRLSAGSRWELSERGLPTGTLLPLTDEENLLRTTGLMPTGKAIEWAFTAQPITVNGKDFNGAVLTDIARHRSVYYEVDAQYKHWTFWNNGGAVNWACPEPQTWAINAPNLSLPAEVTGFQTIAPGNEWHADSKLYVD